jgi:hypothetical protein
MPETAYIEYLGGITAGRYVMSDWEVHELGEFTRERITWWFERFRNQGYMFWPIQDLHAVCGDMDIPWATEEGKRIWDMVPNRFPPLVP